ncbi:DUF1249 domain-containing protein [Wenzhouxiangellaceae bacterium CH-27]|uniref:DUF1249 domain-containing protein n=2 Tax=Elongatibacter sediminis TaxID=3119006 RepID=A0AAW9RDA6_9GAMM
MPPKLRRLQEVQAEIYRQLQLLLPDDIAFHDHLRSCVPGSAPLCLDVLERHPYTTFFRLTYEFSGTENREFEPDAHVRFYHDARMAEATSFDCDQACTRDSHPAYPPAALMRRTWRQNRALDRWLDFLLRQGHSAQTMAPVESAAGRSEAVPSPVTAG